MRSRRLSAAVSWLALAAQLCALAHVILERHETCPAHGEAVHAQADTPAPPPAGTDTMAAAPTGDGADEHCLALAVVRADGAELRQATVASAAEPAPISIRRIDDVVRHGGRALLSLAPKTSPPRAA